VPPLLFPYRYRPYQRELVELVAAAVQEERHLVLQSATGTGKTVSALAGVLGVVRASPKRVLYLTRTIAQEDQVMRELRAISKLERTAGVALQGRMHTCLLIASGETGEPPGTPEELSRFCGARKARVLEGEQGACRFYAELLHRDLTPIFRHLREALPTAEEFVAYCRERGLCPYEAVKLFAQEAKVVAAPYVFFFSPFIRRALLDWMGAELGDLVLILDEAHNLPEYCRELQSLRLSSELLTAAERELVEFGDPELAPGTSAHDLLEALRSLLRDAIKEYVLDEDGLLPPRFLEDGLLAKLKLGGQALAGAVAALRAFGETIRAQRQQEGRLPRSYLYAVGLFLDVWGNLDDVHNARLILGGENPTFEAACLDASLAAEPLAGCAATVHMSGTLEPLPEYRDTLGLPGGTQLAVVPSPFPPEHRLMLYEPGCTTKYEELGRDPSLLPRLADRIIALCNGTQRSTLVVVPSFRLMEELLRLGVALRLHRPLLIEQPSLSQAELMGLVRRFRAQPGRTVLFAVYGGRLAEGLDYPDRALEVVVLVGLPYPKPTARQRALEHYCELRFGQGWDYAVKAPTIRRLLQAAGRLIRSETDRGVAVLLERRAPQLAAHFPARRCEDAVGELRAFFSEPVASAEQLPDTGAREPQLTQFE